MFKKGLFKKIDKNVLKVLALISFMAVPLSAQMETIDVQVDSVTYKSVQVNSSGYTLLISMPEIWVSTSSVVNPMYKMIYWSARHDSAVPIGVTADESQLIDQVIPWKSDEFFIEKSYKNSMSAKLKSSLTGTTTVYVQIGYKKIR